MVDLSVNVGAVSLQNPVMPASGTFSNEFAQVIDLQPPGRARDEDGVEALSARQSSARVHEIESA
jgi:dihydroorotate dehydrogenase (NAD+) catalytic subunit